MPTTTQPIPIWYKASPLWPIPQDWEILKIKDFSNVITWNTPDTNDLSNYWDEYLFVWPWDLSDTKYIINSSKKLSTKWFLKSRKMPKGSILFTSIGSSIGKTWIAKFDLTANQQINTLLPNPNYSSDFIYYELGRLSEKIKMLAWEQAVPIINKSDFEKVKLTFPPLPEQTAIATILSTLDTTIQQTQEIIKKLELRNKGLVQKLLTGKIRVKGFNWDPEFHILWKYIEEVSIKNKNGQIDNVLSVTNSRGFINQSEQFEREVASLDRSNYKIVKKWQFAYNPSRVNVWSIDLLRNFEEGILSPMYVVFETLQDKLIPEFLYYHLKSHRFFGHIPMFVQWSVRDSLWFDWLSAMKFFIPSIEEQKKITEILNKATKEVKKQKQKLVKLQTLKKWLMQQLLTWKVRVKEFRK